METLRLECPVTDPIWMGLELGVLAIWLLKLKLPPPGPVRPVPILIEFDDVIVL